MPLSLVKLGICLVVGLGIYNLAKFIGPLFPGLLIIVWWWFRRGPFPIKVAVITTAIFGILTLGVGWGGLWGLNLIVGVVFLLIPQRLTDKVLRGTTLATVKELQRQLVKKEQQQTTAQMEEIYGERGARIILQGVATKLILNIRDGATAEQFSKMIGVQERIDVTVSKSQSNDGGFSQSEQIRETAAVLPSELLYLPSLEGYLCIADGSSPARVKVTPQSYPTIADRFVPIETII